MTTRVFDLHDEAYDVWRDAGGRDASPGAVHVRGADVDVDCFFTTGRAW
jgi:hypothetical protein